MYVTLLHMQRCVKCPPSSIQTDDKNKRTQFILCVRLQNDLHLLSNKSTTFLVMSGSATSSGFINSHTKQPFCKYEWQNTSQSVCHPWKLHFIVR